MTPVAGRRLAGWQHGLAIGALVLATALRFHASLFSPEPLGDELAQERAQVQAAAGKSPYTDGNYVYPPSLLRLGQAVRTLPLASPFLPLRVLSLIGLAFVVWYATGRFGWRVPTRLLVAVAYLALAPGVRQGIEFGNLSFAVAGLLLLGLLAWRRATLGSALSLGVSLLLKPLAPAALVTLFCHRPPAGHRHQLAAGLAALFAAAALLADPEFGPFLRHGSDSWVVGRSVSLHRFLALAGVPGAATLLMLGLFAVLAWVSRRWVRSEPQLLAVALAGCVTATPVVWNHTLVLTLPLQAMALALAVERRRAAAGSDRRARGWELTGIALAVAALTFGEGATGIDDRGLALQIFATLPPALAPAFLAAYVVRFQPCPWDPAASPAAPRARNSS